MCLRDPGLQGIDHEGPGTLNQQRPGTLGTGANPAGWERFGLVKSERAAGKGGWPPERVATQLHHWLWSLEGERDGIVP